ncbi:MAG: exodeoxyribonuclease VII large subunit [Pseudomonadota bacterium]
MDDSAPTNSQELTVSELASSLKRTIETNYDRVRVRGELGRVTIARSGHMYADIKDDKAVLNTVMWKGQVSALPFRPEEGLEVVAEGKLSIYAGRSNYQLLASSMRPAGVGALMALLEDRKKKLTAEGLFDPAHKKALPHLPTTIGVVTSPTGAVIRDILHRIRERFPVRVIVWPALVQGDLAAGQIEAGIRGFNGIAGDDRPDILIVARGGGSIEDLWPFNEEAVVRAAFESDIPLISAVGHETDTTLIDFVSDARAPTPTGAAEIAVPVRADLLLTNEELGQRLKRALRQRVTTGRDSLRAARLPRPEGLLERARQRMDYANASLPRATLSLVERAKARLERSTLALPHPSSLVQNARIQFERSTLGLISGLRAAVNVKRLAHTKVAGGLRHDPLASDAKRARRDLVSTARRARPALFRTLTALSERSVNAGKMLNTLSYEATLKRGFALIRSDDGRLVRSKRALTAGEAVQITLSDGDISAQIGGSTPPPKPIEAPVKSKQKPRPKSASTPEDQGNLF